MAPPCIPCRVEDRQSDCTSCLLSTHFPPEDFPKFRALVRYCGAVAQVRYELGARGSTEHRNCWIRSTLRSQMMVELGLDPSDTNYLVDHCLPCLIEDQLSECTHCMLNEFFAPTPNDFAKFSAPVQQFGSVKKVRDSLAALSTLEKRNRWVCNRLKEDMLLVVFDPVDGWVGKLEEYQRNLRPLVSLALQRTVRCKGFSTNIVCLLLKIMVSRRMHIMAW